MSVARWKGPFQERIPSTRPGFIPPMLAMRVAELPEGVEWEYEVKWDGYRIEAVKDESIVHLFSRRGADYSTRFKAVTKAVTAIRATTAVLDGEVVRFARAVPKKTWLEARLWLKRRAEHPRRRRVESYGRLGYGHYFRLAQTSDVDDLLAALMREAYAIGKQDYQA